jgi:hypothetical protein
MLKQLLNSVEAAVTQQVKQLCSCFISRLAGQQDSADSQGKCII